MQKQVDVTKIVSISPLYMDHNIIKTVYHILKSKFEKNCNEDDGIILSIGDIKSIENMISKDSSQIIFSITFESSVVKPQKGDKVSFTPTLIINKGIFGKVYDTINLFIPESNMKGWTFDPQTNSFSNENGDIINKEKEITASISDTKFSVTKYNCICSF